MKIFVGNASGLVHRGRHARTFSLPVSIAAMLVVNAGCERANGKGAAGAGPPRLEVQVVAGAAKGCARSTRSGSALSMDW